MTLFYRIGPFRIRLDAKRPAWDLDNAFYRPFKTAPDDVELHAVVHEEAPPAAPASWDFALEGHWRVARQGEGVRLEILEQIEGQPRLVALVAGDWRHVDLFIRPLPYRIGERPDNVWLISEAFDPFLQWWMTARLAEAGRGLVLHSAAVSFAGDGLIFVGRSGAGKSTLAGWCHGRDRLTVLNDERLLVWRDAEGWKVSGTPWSGTLAQASHLIVPLKRVHLLIQAPVFEWRPVPPKVACWRVLEEASLPLWQPDWSARAIEAASALTREVPCGELHNRKEAAVVDFLWQSIAGDVAEVR